MNDIRHCRFVFSFAVCGRKIQLDLHGSKHVTQALKDPLIMIPTLIFGHSPLVLLLIDAIVWVVSHLSPLTSHPKRGIERTRRCLMVLA